MKIKKPKTSLEADRAYADADAEADADLPKNVQRFHSDHFFTSKSKWLQTNEDKCPVLLLL